MAHLWLGVGAKVTVLVSCLLPKNLISKAYVNHTKANKVEGLVVVSEGPKLICHEEKVVVIVRHPPKDQQTEEFDCWTIHRSAHVTEEGEESGLFATPNSGGGNNGNRISSKDSIRLLVTCVTSYNFVSLYTKNRWVINVMGSPIDVGGQYPFITFFTLPRLSGKFLLMVDH